MATNGHRTTGSVSQVQNHKAQLVSAYNELGKELSSQKIRVIGNYTLGKVIGEGTYGKVRLGIHRLTGSKVAIKQIPKAMSSSLTREIHHHRQLHHPHVCQLFEVIATESNIWLVTELCSGGELFDYLAEKGRLGEDEARMLFGQLCLAVAYVHEKGIVHRDLKLENVLLDEKCRVKLGDFGFTREFEKGILLETFCGTTGYASPEMLLAKKYLGPEVDVWSLGIILYTLLTGTLPFDDDDDNVMREKVIKGDFEDPEWLSDEARDLIKNVLTVDPDKRLSIAQILAHPWFTVTGPNSATSPHYTPSSPPGSPTRIHAPAMGTGPQLTATTSVTSNATYHSASCESFPTTPLTPDEAADDVFQTSAADPETRERQSELTLKKLTANERKTPDIGDDSLDALGSATSPDGDMRPSISRTTTVSNFSSRGPPTAFPTRTPARTKRRSVSSTLSNPDAPSSATFEVPKTPVPPQDFSSLLSTPAPIIFSTPLERDLLTDLSSIGFDTGQIVHSVLTDACDATGSLWWLLKRKAEKKSLEEGLTKTTVDVVEVAEEVDGKEVKSRSAGRASPSLPLALAATSSAPELQFIPPTPTAASTNTKRATTPPRSMSPNERTLSPTPSTIMLDAAVRSHPSTPAGSLKEKDKDSQGSKGRKNRAGSVSIMQRATTALEAAGLVRKKSAEAVKEEKDKSSTDKRVTSGEEPRVSGGSNKLAKSPPMKALKDLSIPSTPSQSFESQPASTQVGSPWVIANGKHSPPPTPANSPGDTLGSLPNIPEHSGKLGQNRNRASLLSAFRMWFKEDPKGKRKEQPALSTQGLQHGGPLNGQPVHSPGTSPINGRGRGSIKLRTGGRAKVAVGRKTGHRTKRTSTSSRRSSSVNSKRSSVTSTQFAVLEASQYSPDQMPPMSRQRSDPSRKGSHTPNSERDEYVSRPSSIQSFHHRHHKSPSASSAGSMYGRTASPLPKYHRRAGSGSSTRVVRQAQPSTPMGKTGAHLRSNSTSSNHSLASSRHGSFYELSETEGRRGSPNKTPSRGSFDDSTPRRAATFVAQKRQTPFTHPLSSGYLNSIGRSSWKKSWGLEPPGWQTRSAHPAMVEVLAVSDGAAGDNIRDVFTGRQSLNMGDESDWVDEDDDVTGYVGGLGQMTTSLSAPASYPSTIDSPLLPTMSKSQSRGAPGTKLQTTNLNAINSRQGRSKSGGRSPAGRSSPLPGESTFDSSGRRTQLPAGRSGPAAIQEEDEDEEEE
ncbi:hypothetical protein EIP91_011485 [Steccherinum ochraceum]|uniref:Protein kinase domain-containing protein n=1 Tax=Steccherinum ochraceum TaxID=92696 RepID=A0A4R0RHV4_9APHY|nr:hypothetical protein EIP91_011485 [Steccherinum ochraceum]